MCLIPDPLIWSFGIDSALSLHDLWTLLGPMIMSFICGFMASGIWVYAAEIISFVQAWQWTMAPILWLAMLFTIIFHCPSEKPPFDHREHCFYAKQCHCHSRHHQVPCWKYPRSWSPSQVPNPSMLHGSLCQPQGAHLLSTDHHVATEDTSLSGPLHPPMC